jgi:NAD(P)-dependent dehydrogenase (short-subunit alcohol dehydrogenase family)
MKKKVLVTGSTKGIGKAIAEKFHSKGWDVGITARGQTEINEITNLYNQKRQNSAIGIRADLSIKEEIINLKHRLEQEWQEIDCIVFNVGSGSGTKGLTSTSQENELSLRTNYLDVVMAFRNLQSLIRKEMGGSIVFIGSISQAVNVKAPISYSNAKRALNNFAFSKSLELASKKISVNLINPGHILTKNGIWERKMQSSNEEFEKFVSKNIPIGRIGQVEDVAELVFLTANNEYRQYLTGSRITLDGGTSLIS